MTRRGIAQGWFLGKFIAYTFLAMRNLLKLFLFRLDLKKLQDLKTDTKNQPKPPDTNESKNGSIFGKSNETAAKVQRKGIFFIFIYFYGTLFFSL